MSEPTHDIIAINDRGVYAICYDMPGDDYVAEFKREALAAGHRVERVTTKEACERHLAYLRTLPGFREVLPPTPSHSPSGMGGARGG